MGRRRRQQGRRGGLPTATVLRTSAPAASVGGGAPSQPWEPGPRSLLHAGTSYSAFWETETQSGGEGGGWGGPRPAFNRRREQQRSHRWRSIPQSRLEGSTGSAPPKAAGYSQTRRSGGAAWSTGARPQMRPPSLPGLEALHRDAASRPAGDPSSPPRALAPRDPPARDLPGLRGRRQRGLSRRPARRRPLQQELPPQLLAEFGHPRFRDPLVISLPLSCAPRPRPVLEPGPWRGRGRSAIQPTLPLPCCAPSLSDP